MTFTEEADRTFDHCPECKGLFFGPDEVARALGGAGHGLRSRVAGLAQGALPCPRDGKPMRVLMHEGVELDLCADCGSLWLDAGELGKVGKKGVRKGRKAAATAALVAAAGLSAGAVAAEPAARGSLVGDIASGVGELAVDGVVEVALEFAGEAIGALLDGLF
jgi:Zn-finger nucleic acid-binding protein